MTPTVAYWLLLDSCLNCGRLPSSQQAPPAVSVALQRRLCTLPEMLHEACRSEQAALVELLLDANHPMTDAAVFTCVDRHDAAALVACLSRGTPPQAQRHKLLSSYPPRLPSKSGAYRHTCPVLCVPDDRRGLPSRVRHCALDFLLHS